MKSACILLLVLISLVQHSFADDPALVIEMIRHGARSNSDPTDNTWPNHDELTPVGMRQHYILGKILAKSYPNILGEYNASKIFIRSTNFNRTLMSATTQLHAIFENLGQTLTPNINKSALVPPFDTPLIDKILADLDNITAALPDQIQVVPITTFDISQDELLYGGPGTCPSSAQWFKDRPLDDQAKQIFNNLNRTTEALAKLGRNMTQLQELFVLGDTLVANHYDERPLPLGIEFNSTLYNDSLFASQWFTNYVYTGTGDMLRVNCYLLVNTIIDWFDGVVKGTNPFQFIMLSGHDTTLLRLLGLYNITHPECLSRNQQSMAAGNSLPFPNCVYPSYASQFIFEFYNSTTEEPYIKVLYNAQPVDICVNGQNKCTLSDFKTLSNKLLDLTYDQYKTICGVIKPNNDPGSNTLTIVLVTIACVLLVAVIAIVVIYKLRSKRIAKKSARINDDEYNRIEEALPSSLSRDSCFTGQKNYGGAASYLKFRTTSVCNLNFD